MLGPVFAFNVAAELAWWAGSSFTLISLICVLLMVALRLRSDLEQRRRIKVAGRIEPLLFQATEQATAADDGSENDNGSPVPAVSDISSDFDGRQGFLLFLEEWNYLHESLDGEAKNGLNKLANNLRIIDEITTLLDSPFIDRRLLAINTLGNLREASAYERIEKLASLADPIVSSWAWRALMRIDTEAAVNRDLKMIAGRDDWSPIFVAEVLQGLDADILSVPLCSLVRECHEQRLHERQMARLISYLIFSHVYDHNTLISRIINESGEKEVLIACLRLVQDDSVLARVRELAKDERWEVRLQVVLTLGRLGHAEDSELLINALGDTDWWVRYRAASALINMPDVSRKQIDRLSRTLPNEFARDILNQVKAEMELSCLKPSSLALSR